MAMPNTSVGTAPPTNSAQSQPERQPCGEDRAGAEDQPDLVPLPYRADGIDDDASLDVGARDQRQEDADAKVETIHDRETDQQEAEQQPPHDLQGLELEHALS
jgi:hypothetical protein